MVREIISDLEKQINRCIEHLDQIWRQILFASGPKI